MGEHEPEWRGGNGNKALADSAHPARPPVKADRDVGPEPDKIGRLRQSKVAPARQKSQCGGSVRGPSPEPCGDRQLFLEPQCRPAAAGQQAGGRAKNEIVAVGGETIGKGPGDGQRQAVGVLRLHDVADAWKDHQTVKQMIPVRTSARDVEREIDLGRRELRARRVADRHR